MDGGAGNDKQALIVGGAGAGVFLLGLLFGSRFLKLVGLIAAVAGGGRLVQAKLSSRNDKIDAAADTIRSTLDDLDPFARAEVLADLSQSDPAGAES